MHFAIERIRYSLQHTVIGWIRIYQQTLSPNHGPAAGGVRGCRYYPSCSEYMARSIMYNGLMKGSVRGVWRILRCNPFSAGGADTSYKK